MKRICEVSGLTLVELILAVVLLSVVIFTGMSMEMAVRRTLNTVDYESELMGEVVAIMSLVTGFINQGIGTVTVSPYSNTSLGTYDDFFIRQDTNGNGRLDPATDLQIKFRFWRQGQNRNQLWYYADGSSASSTLNLTGRCLSFAIAAPFNGSSNVSIVLQRDPGNAVNNLTNPRVSLSSNVQYRMWSLR